VATVRTRVALGLMTDFVNFREFTPQPFQAQSLNVMLDQLVAWSSALAPLRSPAAAAVPAQA
jgi:hypothetical protein